MLHFQATTLFYIHSVKLSKQSERKLLQTHTLHSTAYIPTDPQSSSTNAHQPTHTTATTFNLLDRRISGNLDLYNPRSPHRSEPIGTQSVLSINQSIDTFLYSLSNYTISHLKHAANIHTSIIPHFPYKIPIALFMLSFGNWSRR